MKYQKIINNIKQMDKRVFKIAKNVIKISIIICLLSIYILSTYTIIGEPIAYYIGLSLLKTGLFFCTGCIICGVIFNKIIEE